MKSKKLREPKTRKLSRRMHIQLIECGGALAELLLYLVRNDLTRDSEEIRTAVINWDAAVLEIPEEFLK